MGTYFCAGPKITVSFPGFTDANVCDGSVGQIDIDSYFFASMQACGTTDWDKDTSKSAGPIETYGTGWAKASHTFKKSGTWKFSGTSAPYTESFTISDSCDCSTQTVPQKITVESKLTNGGITLGDSEQKAIVQYDATDSTTCTP